MPEQLSSVPGNTATQLPSATQNVVMIAGREHAGVAAGHAVGPVDVPVASSAASRAAGKIHR